MFLPYLKVILRQESRISLPIVGNLTLAEKRRVEHGFDAANLLDRLRSSHSLLVQEKEKLIKDRAKFDQELDELNKLLVICDIQLTCHKPT
ncbi:hypothetical protein RCL_jg26858.t1 [Rhizophagus clarus]|uniref:Uncharacterized protein n=1 Tax=Rhizophagus clarus TaxID=94130 RepID=A0A8H3LF44_9GLOM|nr:hypothetical protein RCL_jg26858.t1 [Rhizophagus clarus]